jgi:menaquinone-dependent protoporphyrinogen oxidase
MTQHLTLCTVPVFFATSEGQTRRIAERFAAVLKQEGLDSATYDVADLADVTIDWRRVQAVILGASLHVLRHQKAAHAFATAFAPRLNAVPSLFFSVSLSAASINAAEVNAAQRIADGFPPACGWRPNAVISLAGRLAYSQYGLLKRMVIRHIAKREGAPTDTSRDYEFTSWERVDALAKDMAGRARSAAPRAA